MDSELEYTESFTSVDLNNKLSEDIGKNKTIQGVQYQFSKSMVNHLDVASADNVIKHFINRSSAKTKDKRAIYAYNMVSLIDYLQSVEVEITKQLTEVFGNETFSSSTQDYHHVMCDQEHTVSGDITTLLSPSGKMKEFLNENDGVFLGLFINMQFLFIHTYQL